MALRCGDVDLILGQISVVRGLHVIGGSKAIFTQPKSAKSRRTIALSPSAILMLQEHRQNAQHLQNRLGAKLTDQNLVFARADGTTLLPNSVSHAWTRIVRLSGIKPIRFHDARHTHASLMLQQGIHPKIVSERLGHSTIAITIDTYSHVTPGLQEAAARRFDEALVTAYNEGGLEVVG